jgi:D-3-phosphoglycerate dehydrogenase
MSSPSTCPAASRPNTCSTASALFGKCRPNLLVVNDARGEVVDEFALAEALKEKKIAGAAIDVFMTEPPQKDHPLFALENAC